MNEQQYQTAATGTALVLWWSMIDVWIFQALPLEKWPSATTSVRVSLSTPIAPPQGDRK